MLARMRWQVELLFKRWKLSWNSERSGAVTTPWRILCEIDAQLLVALFAHWLLVLTCWEIRPQPAQSAAHSPGARRPSGEHLRRPRGAGQRRRVAAVLGGDELVASPNANNARQFTNDCLP